MQLTKILPLIAVLFLTACRQEISTDVQLLF